MPDSEKKKNHKIAPVPLPMIFADTIAQDPSGKIHILGVFQQILALKFPAIQKGMVIYQQFTDFADQKPQPARLTVSYLDGNLEKICTVNTKVNVSGDRLGITYVILTIVGLTLPRQGKLEFAFELNDILITSGTINAVLLQNPAL